MTSTFKNDFSFDLVAENGSLALLAGDAAIAQNTVTAASTRRGECLLDVERGIPFDATVFTNLKLPQFEAAVRAAIRRVPGVTEITTFTAAQASENLEYTVEIKTENGTTVPVQI